MKMSDGDYGQITHPIQDWFNIQINSDLCGYYLINTFFHELVHIEQCLRGDLVFFDETYLYKKKNEKFIPYHERVSEIEAFGRSNLLVDLYLYESGFMNRKFFKQDIYK